METNNKLIGVGLLAALSASLCCITPVLAMLAGSSGIASTFSDLEPFKPYFVGLTILMIGLAWYQKLSPKKHIDCNCNTVEKTEFVHSKMFLVIVTVFALSMLSFPSYAHIFYSYPQNQFITIDKSNIQKVEFMVSGMTCAGCENYVIHEVNKLNGILNVHASYLKGNAIITFDNTKLDKVKIKKAINATGYFIINKANGNNIKINNYLP